MMPFLDIRGYRLFEHLRIDPLRSVNLFIGKNNSGKTSVLEAAELLASGPSLMPAIRILARRGEFLHEPSGATQAALESVVDTTTLFRNRLRTLGGALDISTDSSTLTMTLVAGDTHKITRPGEIALSASYKSPETSWFATTAIALPQAYIDTIDKIRVRTIDSCSWTFSQLAQKWGEVALTEQEDLALDAMRKIDPRIRNLAFDPRPPVTPYIRLQGVSHRSHLGSLGDGVRRLLAIALGLANATDSALLIDDIDTGLHHSVMEQMWRMVIGYSRTHPVQVFATTHSRDCLDSLGRVLHDNPAYHESVAVHRLEAGRDDTVFIDAATLIETIDREIEIR